MYYIWGNVCWLFDETINPNIHVQMNVSNDSNLEGSKQLLAGLKYIPSTTIIIKWAYMGRVGGYKESIQTLF